MNDFSKWTFISFRKINSGVLLTLLCLFAAGADANEFESMQYDSFQSKLLYAPSAEDVEMEQNGRVNIYVGLTDKQVEQVLTRQYDRIGSMMFASIVQTGNDGKPLIDRATGAVLVEEDGCD